MKNQTYDIAVIGLAVMGQNLARNLANQKLKVFTYNRSAEKAEKFIDEHGSDQLDYAKTLKDLVKNLKAPRKLLLMVKAGDPVDQVIDQLLPFLDKGDIVIDGGNSNYHDTIRRTHALEKKGLHFVGMGVSGGEEGALNGPSLMPGGSKEAWEMLAPMLKKIAAKDFNDAPCVAHMGSDGAGHYVKMLHNGIEYAVMQMMAEAYDLLKSLYGLDPNKIGDVFEQFHKGKLQSFLFEIAVPVLKRPDEESGEGYLIDKILDKAGQKGTGRWSAIDALERGIVLSSVTAAVQARSTSSRKEERAKFYQAFGPKTQKPNIELKNFLPLLEDALYAGMICAYAEGLDLIAMAAEEQGWNIDFAEVTRIWQGGCIIRAQLLKTLHEAYLETKGKPVHLFTIPSIQKLLKKHLPALRFGTSVGLAAGLPLPALSNALNYFSSMVRDPLPANFIQGLRDNFGAHTYERNDREGVFHTEWNQ